MGLLLLVFALAAFGTGAFWSAGLSFTIMSEKKWPLYVSIPISVVSGIIGGVACGAAVGFGLAYVMLDP